MVIIFFLAVLTSLVHCAAEPNEKVKTRQIDNSGAVNNGDLGAVTNDSGGDEDSNGGVVNNGNNEDNKLIDKTDMVDAGNTPDTPPKICGDDKRDCVVQLPLFVVGGSGEADLNEPPSEPLFKLDTDALAQFFPAKSSLEYDISSGNPEYTLEYEGSDEKIQRYPLLGYRINENGELYVRDAWLLGRDSLLYLLPDEQQQFFSRNHNGKSLTNAKVCYAGKCPAKKQEKIHGYYYDYTFGRSQSDTLVIQIQDTAGKKSIEQTIIVNPHPRALALKSECTQSDPIDLWSCRHAKELIPPANIQTTASHRNSLPNGLAHSKDSYDLVVNLEFDSLAETKRYFRSVHFEEPNRLEVANGKLILHHEKSLLANGNCRLNFPFLQSLGLFEPASGYLEFNFTKYPNLASNGGNIILWSRYGVGHQDLFFKPPGRLLKDKKTISRSTLAKMGFIEIDLLERFIPNSKNPWFVTHTHPGALKLAGIILDPPIKGYAVKPGWLFKTVRYRSRTTPKNLSAIGGIEVAPRKGVQIFKNGSAVYEKHQLPDYFQDAAMHIIFHGILNGKDGYNCADLPYPKEEIELEYIRLYKPRDGY